MYGFLHYQCIILICNRLKSHYIYDLVQVECCFVFQARKLESSSGSFALNQTKGRNGKSSFALLISRGRTSVLELFSITDLTSFGQRRTAS